MLKTKEDNPSIGILLCKEKNKVKAEYALKDINKPIGISEYELIKAIPEDLKNSDKWVNIFIMKDTDVKVTTTFYKNSDTENSISENRSVISFSMLCASLPSINASYFFFHFFSLTSEMIFSTNKIMIRTINAIKK